MTPAEHLCLPNAQDVLDGLMATKIAAHAADIAKKVPHARDMDDKMGQARRKLDWDAMWECALDPVTGKKRYEESPAATEGTCTISNSDVTMGVKGETFQISLRDANGNKITGLLWVSSDLSICSVDGTGVVKAEGSGTAYVSTTYNGISYQCIVRCNLH